MAAILREETPAAQSELKRNDIEMLRAAGDAFFDQAQAAWLRGAKAGQW
jgi:hypothetical protein